MGGGLAKPGSYMGVSKNRGKTPKMDGLYGKSLLKWMIWGVKPSLFLVQHPYSNYLAKN